MLGDRDGCQGRRRSGSPVLPGHHYSTRYLAGSRARGPGWMGRLCLPRPTNTASFWSTRLGWDRRLRGRDRSVDPRWEIMGASDGYLPSRNTPVGRGFTWHVG